MRCGCDSSDRQWRETTFCTHLFLWSGIRARTTFYAIIIYYTRYYRLSLAGVFIYFSRWRPDPPDRRLTYHFRGQDRVRNSKACNGLPWRCFFFFGFFHFVSDWLVWSNSLCRTRIGEKSVWVLRRFLEKSRP